MKKLILLCIALIFIVACSPEEETTVPFHLELVPVESFSVPEYVMHGNEYDVVVTYRKPTSCYYFHGFTILEDGPVIKIAPQMMVIEGNNCSDLDNAVPEQANFTFTCKNTYSYSSYIFQFYNGEDQIGNQSFYEVEVPVVH